MNELIGLIAAVKAKAKDQCDLASPHVGNALSALDAAAFCLLNEQHRLTAIAAAETAPDTDPAPRP